MRRCTIVQSVVLLLHVVCLSVHLSGRLLRWWIITRGWKSWKLIVRKISPTYFLIVAQRSSTDSHGNLLLLLLLQSSAVQQVLDIPLLYLPGEQGDILRRLEVGWEKVACWSTKAAISLKRVKIEEKLLWGPIGTHQRSFEWCQPRPPTTSSTPILWFITPTKTPMAIISERLRLCISNFLCTFKNFQSTHT